MKKSLWITAAVMAVGIGMSAQADSAALGQWSFEGIAVGTQVTPAGGIGSPSGYTSWTAGTNNGPAYITNASPSVGSYPITGGPGTNVLYFEDSVTNQFAGLPGRFFTDFLLKPGQLEETASIASLDASARLAFYFNTSSNFVLLHGVTAGTAWQTSVFSTVFYRTNEWLRISIEQNYDARNEVDPFKPIFQVYVNGTNLVHDNGYNIEESTLVGTNDGPWFVMRNTAATNMNALVGMGIGMLDDVVTTTNTLVFGSPAPEVIGVLASTFNAAYGNIVTSGYQTLTNGGSARTFTLTVASGAAAYVLSLKAGSVELFSNANQAISATNWDVSYASISAPNTNLVAYFAAKQGTTASYLTNYFNIGSVGYPDFTYATTNDADTDGFTDYQESICGTDPTDGGDYLKIDNISVDGSGNVVLTFQGSTAGAASQYNLVGADTVSGSYGAVTNKTMADGTNTFNVVPAAIKKFYKIVVPYSGQ